MARPIRVAILASHATQYHGPWYRKLAAHSEVELTALFCTPLGVTPYFDAGFKQTVQWDRPLTEGYRHEFLRTLHPRPRPGRFWSLANPALWSRVAPSHFDALILTGWNYASAWLALAAARQHGLPVLLRAESHLGPAGRPWSRRLARHLTLAQLFRRVDGFLAIGSCNAALYRAFGVPASRIFLTPYAVDNEFFLGEHERLAPQRPELRAELGVTDDRPVVIASGKLSARKAPLDLVQAFARVRRELSATLVFLGDGELRGAVESAARQAGIGADVRITGFRNQTEVGRVYEAGDLSVLPSRFETWGLVVNEAMLFGMPVICTTAVAAHEDLVTPGRTGDLYPPGDIDQLAGLLRKRLVDPASLRRMGERAAERIRGWDFDRCVAGTVAALRFVSGSGRAQGSSESTRSWSVVGRETVGRAAKNGRRVPRPR